MTTFNNVVEKIRNKKSDASKMMSFCHDKYMEANPYEGVNWEEEFKQHNAKFKKYHTHFTRYLNNDFTNRYSRFKKLGKKNQINFDSIPLDLDWLSELDI